MSTHKEKKEMVKEKFKPAGFSSLDSKKRITLGSKIMKESPLNHMKVDAFEILVGDEGDILLKPTTNIPSRELWVHQNPEVLESIQRGIRDAKEGRITRVKNLDRFFEEL